MKNVLLICTQPQSGLNMDTVLISVVCPKWAWAPKVRPSGRGPKKISLPPSFNFILEETLPISKLVFCNSRSGYKRRIMIDLFHSCTCPKSILLPYFQGPASVAWLQPSVMLLFLVVLSVPLSSFSSLELVSR